MKNLLLLCAILLAPLPFPGAAAATGANADPCALPAGLADGRPDPEGTPTEVAVGVYVIDVKAIADADQSFTADFYLSVSWRDPRLAAEAGGSSLADCRLEDAAIWRPRVEIVNQRLLRKPYGEVVRLDDSGRVEVQQRYFGQLSSPLDLHDFPFDRQQLPIDVIAIGYGPEEVVLTADPRTGRLADFSLAGWSLGPMEPRLTTEHVASVGRELSRLDFRLAARRHSAYYFWKMLIPLGLIIFMAWTVFWIDPKHVAPQISLSTATVFSLIAFQFSLGRLLPRVSYLTRADRFLLGATLLVFLALGEAVLTSKLAGDREELSRRIDRWARWIYAALFAGLLAYTVWG